MTEIEIGREKLRTALLEICGNYWENVERAPEEDVWYSPELEKKMEKLLKRRSRPWYECFNTTFKKVCAACLLVAVLFGALMSCKPIREPVIKFFQNIYEQFTEFWVDDGNVLEVPKIIEEETTLSYIPNGYELSEKQGIVGKDIALKTVWEDDNGKKIILKQVSLGAKITFDCENLVPEIYSENEIEIFLVKNHNEWFAFWNTDKYSYSLIAQGVSKEEVLNIVKSFAVE